MQKIVVVIPAYNEEKCIGDVVAMVNKHFPAADVVVVNDGSVDHTAQRAQQAGAIVLNLPFNLGIGGAVQTGFKFAAEMEYDIVVRVDGDGQHDPADIAQLLEPIQENRADVVIGSRYVAHVQGDSEGYKASLCRALGAKFFSFITTCIIRQKIADTTSGFQVVNSDVIEFYATEYPVDYPEVEAIPLLHRAGFRILEMPVSMKERAAGKTSITPFRSIYYVIKVLLSLFIGLLRKPPSRSDKEHA